MPSGRRFPPQPGAHAATQFALLSESAIPAPSPAGSPVPPKHDQPGPASPPSSRLASASWPAATLEEDHVVHDLRLTGDDPRGRHERVARLLRVEQEAAVVVGDPLGRRRRVRRLHRRGRGAPRPDAPPGLSAPSACAPGRRSSRRHVPTRGSTRAAARSGSCVLWPDVFRRALPRRPRWHEVRLHGCRDGGRARRDLPRGDERERRDAARPMAAGALLGDDRRDVLREARRCGGARSRGVSAGESRALRAATASATRAAAASAIRVPLRMLGVICTPKLAEDATDLADRAARAERLAHGRQEIRVGLGGVVAPPPATARQHRRRARRGRAPCARTGAARSPDRPAGAPRSPPVSSANAFTPTTTRSPDSPRSGSGTPTLRSRPGRSPARSRRPRHRARRCAR